MKKLALTTLFLTTTALGFSTSAQACDDCSAGHTVVGDGVIVDSTNDVTSISDANAVGVTGDVINGGNTNNVRIEGGKPSAPAAVGASGHADGCLAVVAKGGLSLGGVAGSLTGIGINPGGEVVYSQECEQGMMNIANNTFENQNILNLVNSTDPQERVMGYMALSQKSPLIGDALLKVDDQFASLEFKADATGKVVCYDENGRALSALRIAAMALKLDKEVKSQALAELSSAETVKADKKASNKGPKFKYK